VRGCVLWGIRDDREPEITTSRTKVAANLRLVLANRRRCGICNCSPYRNGVSIFGREARRAHPTQARRSAAQRTAHLAPRSTW